MRAHGPARGGASGLDGATPIAPGKRSLASAIPAPRRNPAPKAAAPGAAAAPRSTTEAAPLADPFALHLGVDASTESTADAPDGAADGDPGSDDQAAATADGADAAPIVVPPVEIDGPARPPVVVPPVEIVGPARPIAVPPVEIVGPGPDPIVVPPVEIESPVKPIVVPPVNIESPAASGQDWGARFGDFLASTNGNALRTGLEVTRLVPGLGAATGAAADGIELYQNLRSLDGAGGRDANKPLAYAMTLRQHIVFANNLIGHARYLTTLAGAVAAPGSGGLSVPLTAAANKTAAQASLLLNTAQLGIDCGIAVGAQMDARRHGEGSPEYAAYLGVRDTFIVNSATDVAAIGLDLLDLATMGAANTPVVQQGKVAFKVANLAAKDLKALILGVIKNWIGIWGTTVKDKALAPGKPTATAANADGAATTDHLAAETPQALRTMAGRVMLLELAQMRAGYRGAAVGVEHLLGTPHRLARDASRVATAISGQKDPFLWVRDRLAEGVRDSSAQASQMMKLSSLAATGERGARAVLDGADRTLAAVSTLHVPTIAPRKTELGDSAIANAVEGAVDSVADAGAAAANVALKKIQVVIDQVVGPASAEIEALRGEVSPFAEFLGEFQTTLNDQTAKVSAQGATFAAELARCQNLDDVFNLILGFGADLLGAEGFTVEELRATWASIRGAIDSGFTLAEGLAAPPDDDHAPAP